MTISIMLITLFAGFLFSAIIGPLAIPFLRRMKFGQSIREEGPQSHMKKQGTPTMGGVIFLFSIVISTFGVSIYYGEFTVQSVVLLIVLLGFGIVGFLDDGLKIIFKRNLGLTSLQKLIAQIVISVLAYFLLKGTGFANELSVPYTEIVLNFGTFYILFMVFWLVGFSNAVNLTDGLDGLVAGTGAIAFAAFGVIAYVQDQTDLSIFSFAVAGALLGFLIFNKNPAKVFMGDTGSLALGGALGIVSILTHQELLLLLIGLVFVVETASVMLQVGSFKIRKKRIFKMAPIHHHFELSGWSEQRVVVTFWIVGIICALIAVLPEVL
ncbi:MAG: phospho-N-acetylmuramoyl-pentapeptide-transferase [Kurthia gibsonii]|uniref:Phospho-N-acetylmuramoyl-pentapeptide-transferase n=1 Tax=Kurthia gibsonii TaxID=33946 RepID=A0ABU9LH42_9BACL|nr:MULTISPECIES: phospho-N-acetylmuramoyl-pentapeptide-transferase [Kurthia]AMA62762.1 phospho-N-acetylmuramoyl-pentapeptide-transferase [Kurthia sp. 11kri321]MEB6111816.1 phospho-N-acetylmuramoyl-pentapeptide-transferase [Kurthia gibsonii]MEB7771676.1 phospho-N-acetylmuramoyl-pentapeptide-transferase [Kurthia gibsonii]RXH53466.1 phospho-N-acetylmuramoyl-pentapeptide-transferase [Kurthia gibsonii]WIL39303.1 phospho-N-acetylmuramoyl-pentapeptide-transferase [Kurthia sp. YJT4]